MSYFCTNYQPRTGSIVKVLERDWECDELRPFSSSLFGDSEIDGNEKADELAQLWNIDPIGKVNMNQEDCIRLNQLSKLSIFVRF